MNYCFDTVEVKVSQLSEVTGSGSGSDDDETNVLVPILRDNRVSVVLESGPEGGTFYTATLFFDSQDITSTNFCETVQKWLINMYFFSSLSCP